MGPRRPLPGDPALGGRCSAPTTDLLAREIDDGFGANPLTLAEVLVVPASQGRLEEVRAALADLFGANSPREVLPGNWILRHSGGEVWRKVSFNRWIDDGIPIAGCGFAVATVTNRSGPGISSPYRWGFTCVII